MVGMVQWMNTMGDFERPRNEDVGSPLAPAPEPTPAPTPAPEPAPAPAAAVSPALRDFLLQYYSGYVVLPQEMYDLFRGDDVLQQLRAFDPNAQWTRTAMWGGEGGDGPLGYRLDFDPSRLPRVGGPGENRHVFDTGFRPVMEGMNLRNPGAVYNDSVYGDLTPYDNIQQERDPWWTVAAPIAVGMLAPWAAGGLAAMGVGAPGLTSAVTGSGLAASSGAIPWWAKAIGRAPSVAKQVSGGANPWGLMAGLGASALGAPYGVPELAQAGVSTLTSQPRAYNPGAVGNAGTPAKPNADSKMVAPEFAADPYGFSKGA